MTTRIQSDYLAPFYTRTGFGDLQIAVIKGICEERRGHPPGDAWEWLGDAVVIGEISAAFGEWRRLREVLSGK